MSLLGIIVYEKKHFNKLVEDELAEFRKEIEYKFHFAQTKNYEMVRFFDEPGQPDRQKKLTKIHSRITLDGNFLEMSYEDDDRSSDQPDSLYQSKHESLMVLEEECVGEIFGRVCLTED